MLGLKNRREKFRVKLLFIKEIFPFIVEITPQQYFLSLELEHQLEL